MKGRPKLDDTNKKSTNINFRILREHKHLIDVASRLAGVTASQWMTEVLVREAEAVMERSGSGQ